MKEKTIKIRSGAKIMVKEPSMTFSSPTKSVEYPSFGKSEIRVWMGGNIGWLVLLFLLVFVSYANALGNTFVADDRGFAEHARAWTFVSNFSQPNIFLRDFLYFITFHMFGLNPFFLRLPNILFHLGIVWLVFFLLSRIANKKIAIFAASLFAVHPILVESITWISGGVYAQYSFFFLLSFVAYLFSQKNIRAYMFSLFFFLLALLSSEKAIVLSLVFPLFELSFENIKRNWKKSLPYLIAGTLLILIYLPRLGPRQIEVQGGNLSNQIIMNPFEQIPIAITSYFELIFWPDKLTLYHTELAFGQINYLIRVLVFLTFILLIIFCYKKNRLLFFWLSFFILYLLVTLTPLGISWVVAERYVYLGSLGIFITVAWVFAKLTNITKIKVFAYGTFFLIIVSLTVRTMVRNVDWYNEDNLWLSAARTSPSSPQNHNNLGDYYGRHGDLENSVREFKRAIALKPNYADAYHNLGNAYRDMGKTTEALENYEKALSFNPKIWQSYQNIAAIYYQQGDYKKAKEYIEKGMSIDPQNPNLAVIAGPIYIKMGEKEKGKSLLLQILQIDPTNQLAKQGLQELEQK